MSEEAKRPRKTQSEIPEADRPMVAATLAAALLARGKPEEKATKDASAAVRQYRKVLARLSGSAGEEDDDDSEDGSGE